ncbi:MAG: acyl-CoA dehydrogenase family protein [Myxococcales bacterium]|nr:acyl-CoA dehydrogenase family protein [Myxococcales bacterium]
MKSLFHGVIAEDLVAPFPELSAPEREVVTPLLDGFRKFAADHIDPRAIDADAAIPENVVDGLRQQGLFGVLAPRAHGGLGLSTFAYARLMQEVGAHDGSVALMLTAHQSLGTMGLLLFGTDAQKRKYLPRVASGESIASFCLTEPSAGSDAAGIQTRADPAVDGEGWILEGQKSWIANGDRADLFTVFARTSKEEVKPRLTAFLVERAHGVRTGPRLDKHGVRGLGTTDARFEAVRVPHGNVLGDPGRGFQVAMEVLNRGRLGLTASAVGACRTLVDASIVHASSRRAFGRAIGELGLVRDKIARMTIDTFALESAVYLTAGLVDGQAAADFSLESAICKVLGSEVFLRVSHEAAQLVGGRAYARSSFERLLRDARAHLIFGGTNEIMRCFIALSGMQGPGKEISEVVRAMREPIKGFGLLSDFAIRKARSALGRERLHRVHPLLNRETVLFEEYTAELAKNVDKVLRKHGKDIAEMQFTQRRIADLAIDLYALVACPSRATKAIERRGEEGARREVELTTAFASGAEVRMADTVRAFDRNDDELRKAIAVRGYADGNYPLDVL